MLFGSVGMVNVYATEVEIPIVQVSNLKYYTNNSDYLQKARKYGHFTGYKN